MKVLFSKFNELYLVDSRIDIETNKVVASLVVMRPPFHKDKYELRSDPITPVGVVYIDKDLGKLTQENIITDLELDFEQYEKP